MYYTKVLIRVCRGSQQILRNSLVKNQYCFARTMTLDGSDTSTPGSTDTSIKDLKELLARKMGVEPGYTPIPPSRAHLLKYLPKDQSELPPRSMADSFLTTLIPLSTDHDLQDKYITFLGHVRLGRLLEDMDIFAVMVAEKHLLNPKKPDDIPLPHTLVTALVDEIDFTDYVPKSNEDIKISGHVSWAGRSSMEIVVWLEQNLHGTWQRITRALFLIVARDPTNKTAAVVNPIVPANEREKKIFSGGQQRKKSRLITASKHLSKVIPDEEEQQIVHNLYLRTTQNTSIKTRVLPSGSVWMENCRVSNVIFSHPEHRNLHNTVFGGFIMRQATEVSWVCGYVYSKYRPKLKSISDINFTKPIAVNSLIRMHAYVVYVELNFFQIMVYVETFDPSSGEHSTTNTFQFTYEAPEMVPKVIPVTYHEAMMYIDGRRHFNEVMRNNQGSSMDMLTENDILGISKL